jgi:hypothetical protein
MNNRREFLKTSGSGSAALLLAPFMSHMRLHAAGKESGLPKRFVFISKSNCFLPSTLLPKDLANHQGKGPRTELAVHDTNGMTFNDESMRSLDPYMDQITVLQGLSSKVVQSGGGHANLPGVYGCYSTSAGGVPKAITIEPALGQELPAIFNHLSFETGSKMDSVFKYSRISAQGKGQPAPTYVSPVYAYRDIFGSVATTESAKNELAWKRNLLDFLIDDVKSLQKKLSSEEKEKLGHYLHGFETLNKRQDAIAKKGNSILKHAPKIDDDFSKDVDTSRLTAHFDMAAASLITGMTNAVSIRCDNLKNEYTGLGGNDVFRDIHYAGHRRGQEGYGDWFTKINTFQVDLIAKLAAKLKSVPEGNGTMLDNTLIIYSCDQGSKIHGNFDKMPVMLLGNINGRFKTGQYIDYPNYNEDGHQTLRNMYLSLFNAIGQPRDEFNSIDHALKKSISQSSPLEAIMA